MRQRSEVFLLVIAVLAAVSLSTADSAKERTITLQFAPQETTGSSSPTLHEGMTSRPVSLLFEDARPPSEVSIVGEGTDDDDHPFPWRAANSIPDFTKEILLRTAQGWGVRFEQAADLSLVVRLTRFFVSEKDQAVGSTYAADVRISFELREPEAKILASSTASGSARRYGRKRSADNCNEVLSDAMKQAYANMFDQPALQAAWSTKEAGSGGSKLQGLSPAALLVEVISLRGKGLSPELLVSYVDQQVLSTPMTAEDLGEWKKADLPESVIKAALQRSAAAKRQ